MEITWLGGSAVRVRSGDAVVVMGADDALPNDLAADIVTLSCGGPRSVGDARVLSGPGEYEIAGFYISGLATALSAGDAEGTERRINTVFSLRAEDVSVCHLGAVAGALTPRQAQEIGQPDALVVEAGGAGLPVAAAAQLVNQISPRIVVPVGYSAGDGEGDGLAPLSRLLGELGVTEAAEQARLSVTATNLPRDMRVVALKAAG